MGRAICVQKISIFNEFAKKGGERIGSFLDYFESSENVVTPLYLTPYKQKRLARVLEVLAKMPKFALSADWPSQSTFFRFFIPSPLQLRAATKSLVRTSAASVAGFARIQRRLD